MRCSLGLVAVYGSVNIRLTKGCWVMEKKTASYYILYSGELNGQSWEHEIESTAGVGLYELLSISGLHRVPLGVDTRVLLVV